jgi:zinc protease
MSARTKLISALAITCGLLALIPEAARAAGGQVTDRSQIVFPPLHEFHPQQPRRIQLPNGMIIFLQEDHELPLIRGEARIRGGSREEPADKVGLVNIFGQVWRTGGTKAQTGDQLDDYLEARGAKVETSGALDSTTISWDCLKDNFDEVFPTFVELLRQPEFREDKLPLAKTQLNTSISRRNDNPFQIAFREASKLVYGATSPYARIPEYATVAAVTRDDLLNWHRTYVQPNDIILGVVGDFDLRAMEATLRKAFASWEKGPAVKKAEATIQSPKPGVYFIGKDDVTESLIQMMDVGTTRKNPDYFAIEVFNQFFGGSFSSRLFSNIRSKKGLAYAVWGGIEAEYDHPGLLRLALGTKNGTTAAAIDAFNEEVRALDSNPATSEELKKAKEAILNSFIFRLDTKEKVLRERLAYEFYGYPADFLERYRVGIEKVTEQDVGRVAHRYIRKDRLALLVVGKASDFDRPLSSFGPVTTLDITIPAPAAAKAKPAGGSNAEGKALLAKVIQGLGGEAKVGSVKSVRQKVSILANTPQGEMSIEAEQVAVFPDRLWQKMSLPMGEMLMVVSPAAAFMQAPMGSQDLPASQKEDILQELKRDPLNVAQHGDDPKFTFSAGGSEKVGDVEARVLDVNADGAEVRWFVDPQSGRILRASAHGMGMSGPGERVVDYSDWKSVQGVSFPFKETRTLSGQKESSVEVKELEINTAIDPKLFEKPAPKTGSP